MKMMKMLKKKISKKITNKNQWNLFIPMSTNQMIHRTKNSRKRLFQLSLLVRTALFMIWFLIDLKWKKLHRKMDLTTSAKFKRMSSRAKEFKNVYMISKLNIIKGQPKRNILEIFKMTKQMEKEFLPMKTDQDFMGHGKIIILVALVSSKKLRLIQPIVVILATNF